MKIMRFAFVSMFLLVSVGCYAQETRVEIVALQHFVSKLDESFDKTEGKYHYLMVDSDGAGKAVAAATGLRCEDVVEGQRIANENGWIQVKIYYYGSILESESEVIVEVAYVISPAGVGRKKMWLNRKSGEWAVVKEVWTTFA